MPTFRTNKTLESQTNCRQEVDPQQASPPRTGPEPKIPLHQIAFNTDKGGEIARKLRALPNPQPVEMRLGRDANLFGSNSTTNIQAVLGQSVGTIASPACRSCVRGFGPFTSCKLVDGFFGGACAGCHFNNLSRRCTIRRQLEYDQSRGITSSPFGQTKVAQASTSQASTSQVPVSRSNAPMQPSPRPKSTPQSRNQNNGGSAPQQRTTGMPPSNPNGGQTAPRSQRVDPGLAMALSFIAAATPGMPQPNRLEVAASLRRVALTAEHFANLLDPQLPPPRAPEQRQQEGGKQVEENEEDVDAEGETE